MAEHARAVPPERLAEILDIAEDAVVTVNLERRIVQFNRGAARIFGYTAQEAFGQELEFLLPERYRAAHVGQVADFAVGPVVSRIMGERRVVAGRRKDGTEFPAEVTISKLVRGIRSPLPQTDRPTGPAAGPGRPRRAAPPAGGVRSLAVGRRSGDRGGTRPAADAAAADSASPLRPDSAPAARHSKSVVPAQLDAASFTPAPPLPTRYAGQPRRLPSPRLTYAEVGHGDAAELGGAPDVQPGVDPRQGVQRRRGRRAGRSGSTSSTRGATSASATRRSARSTARWRTTRSCPGTSTRRASTSRWTRTSRATCGRRTTRRSPSTRSSPPTPSTPSTSPAAPTTWCPTGRPPRSRTPSCSRRCGPTSGSPSPAWSCPAAATSPSSARSASSWA